MARTNALTTAKRIRRQLHAGQRLDLGVLRTAIGSSDTVLDFTGSLPVSVRAGALLGIDLELMRVVSVNSGAAQATVVRGYHDSEAVGHDAGSQIEINSRFTMLDVFEAMQAEIASWGSELFKVASDTFSVDTSASIYELPADWTNCIGVVSVRQSTDSVDAASWPRINYTLQRGIAGEFDGASTSGLLLRFLEPIRAGGLYVVVALPFDPSSLDVTTDLVDDLGLSDSLVDLVELGVKARLQRDGELNRTARQAQDESRRAEEVPLAGVVQPQSWTYQMYNRRRQEEITRLRRRYPVRMN